MKENRVPNPTRTQRKSITAAASALLALGLLTSAAPAQAAPSPAPATAGIAAARTHAAPVVAKKHKAAKKSVAKRAYRTTSALHLRQRATAHSKSVLVMPRGAAVKATGARSGRWFKVTYKHHAGWASSRYLSTAKAKVHPKKTVKRKVVHQRSRLTSHQRSNLAYATRLARKHHVRIQHSNTRCGTKRGIVLGCTTIGAKTPVAITTAGLNQSRIMVKRIVLHEVSHVIITKKCHGNPYPRIAGSRLERVTDAYSILIGAPHIKHVRYTSADMKKAKMIRAGHCR